MIISLIHHYRPIKYFLQDKLDPPFIRANAIQCSKLDALFSGPEEVNATDSSRNDDSEIIEADSSDIPENRSRRHFTHDLEKLMASSGPLVPSQVAAFVFIPQWSDCFIIRLIT